MNEEKIFIAYYRVSTKEQGNTGLGLGAQQTSVRQFVRDNGSLAGEFIEIESGANNSRRQLDSAIDMCVKLKATLVVKNLSRISRGGYKVMGKLQDLGVMFIESTSPFDNQLIKEFKFSMAKEELERISERTSAALQEIKSKVERGEQHISKAGNVVKSLGMPSNLTDESRQKAKTARVKKALTNLNNKRAGAFILALEKAGVSFYAITAQLNQNGFKTSRGNVFSEVQTKRLFDRYSTVKV